jgi:pantoate kinase
MRAFAPGSVTTVFAPPAAGSDRSKGASFAIGDGVVVDLAPADETRLTVDGEPAPFEPVEYLLRDLDVTAAVDVRPEVPLGCGFGASGAATLAAALAASETFDLDHAREELVTAAHAAEVEAQTGLGDVFVQDEGSIVTSAGAELSRNGSDEPVAYDSFGSISTSEVLGDEETMGRIAETGQAVLDRLPVEPTLAELLPASWEFARETGLVTERVAEAVERIERDGGTATMAMVGETVVGLGPADPLENETRVATEGARLL